MAELEICDLSLQVHLGCTEEERMERQEVRVQLKLEWTKAPEAIFTDRVEDSVCYAKICEILKKLVQDSEFATVEKLAKTSLDAIREKVLSARRVSLTVHKVLPPISQLLGGVKFSLIEENRVHG